jgi:hypothetical protein
MKPTTVISCIGLPDNLIEYLAMNAPVQLLMHPDQYERLRAKLDKVNEQLAETVHTLKLLASPAHPQDPWPDKCRICGKPFSIIEACLAADGLCEACWNKTHRQLCTKCGADTSYSLNGKPLCAACIARVYEAPSSAPTMPDKAPDTKK